MPVLSLFGYIFDDTILFPFDLYISELPVNMMQSMLMQLSICQLILANLTT